MSEEKKYKVTVTHNDDSTVSLTVTLPAENVKKHRKTALNTLGQNIKVDGFRKGHIPEAVLVKEIGELALWKEASQLVIQSTYPEILAQEKLALIGAPNISITKLAPGNELEFRIEASLMPEVELADYKKIACEVYKDTKEESLGEKEVEDAIKNIREQWGRNDKYEKLLAETTSDEDKAKVDPRTIKITEDELPELNEEFVKKLGAFEDVTDFRAKLSGNILAQKQAQAEEKRHAEVIETIREKTKFAMPDILIDSELERMMGQFEADVTRAGLKLEDYLKEVGKTREDLLKEWRPDAKKRAQTQLLLNKMATQENIHPDPDKMIIETEKLKKVHSDAPQMQLAMYVETILTNTAVLEWLASQGTTDSEETSRE